VKRELLRGRRGEGEVGVLIERCRGFNFQPG
jgi:hypothetical protein